MSADEFDNAVTYVESSAPASSSTSSSPALSNATRLSLYAAYKQATAGPCATQQPSILRPVERSKWTAWNNIKTSVFDALHLTTLSRDEAQRRYVTLLDEVQPKWREFKGKNAAKL